ncbi:MAG: 16S rRNA (cytosine(967)-C(5))-methyltransferase RsmB [bacterium]
MRRGEWGEELGVREVALKVLYKVEVNKAHVDSLISDVVSGKKIQTRDIGLLTELVYGVTRFKSKLDWVINNYLERDVYDLTPWIRNILRLGAYQLIYLDRVPSYAVINEAVESAKRHGHQGVANLVNAILRKVLNGYDKVINKRLTIQRDESSLAINYAHPLWLFKRWVDRFGLERTINICEANNTLPFLSLRINTLKTDKESIERSLKEREINFAGSILFEDVIQINEHKGMDQIKDLLATGLIYIQGTSSVIATQVVEPLSDQSILDLCAAPGGKTSYLAQLMKNQGYILALDNNKSRLRLLEENIKKMNVKIAEIRQEDVSEYNEGYQGRFDKVLVDAPCSALGMIRQHPEIKWTRGKEDIEKFSKIQKAILSKAGRYVKDSGKIIYSVCSSETEETTDVVRHFLRNSGAFETDDLSSLASRYNLKAENGWITILPDEQGLDGFFIARMKLSL